MNFEYKNLDRCIDMMSLSSPSDLGKIQGGHGDNRGIAEGAISYAKANAPDGIDKLLYGYLMDAYCDCISNRDKQFLFSRSKRLALELLSKRGMRKKRANAIVRVVLKRAFGGNMTDTECAEMVGINKSKYSENYSKLVNELMSEYEYLLAVADELVGQGMKE